jgi:hypothetical protein
MRNQPSLVAALQAPDRGGRLETADLRNQREEQVARPMWIHEAFIAVDEAGTEPRRRRR